jgi:S-adenosylmethionine hydrolase
MIVLFTDFGLTGPYLGQVTAVLHRLAPSVPVVNLFADAPRFAPRPAAYLLAAYAHEFPQGTVFLAVVDPGVGTASRPPVVLEADGRLYVGPGNGLLQMVAQRAREARLWEILWRPERLSASFHGRDLFAPVAAGLALGRWPERRPLALPAPWPEELAEVIYVDSFGNGMTGLSASLLAPGVRMAVGGQVLGHARNFGEVAPGRAFWYANANGLVELAVNQGSAAERLGLSVGTPVQLLV